MGCGIRGNPGLIFIIVPLANKQYYVAAAFVQRINQFVLQLLVKTFIKPFYGKRRQLLRPQLFTFGHDAGGNKCFGSENFFF